MLDWATIDKRLAKVSRDLVVVFALRAAMRVLPVLANNQGKNEAFGFWDENKAKHVFSIMHVQRSGFVAAATRSVVAVDTADAAEVAAKCVATSYAKAVATARYVLLLLLLLPLLQLLPLQL